MPQSGLIRRLYPGVRARLVVPFLIISIVIAGIGVFIVTRLVAGSVQERFDNQLLDSAQAASNSIAEFERQQLAALRVMTFTEGVAGALTGRDSASLDLWLRPLAANTGIDELIVFDPQGQSILRLTWAQETTGASYTPQPATNIAYWPGARHVLNSEVDTLGDKYIDIVQTPGVPTRIFFSAPVYDARGARAGGIATGANIDRFARRISEQSLSAVALYTLQGEPLSQTFRMISDDELRLTAAQANTLTASVGSASPLQEFRLGGVPYQLLFAPFELRSTPVGLLAVGLPSNFIVQQSSASRDIFAVLFATLFFAVGILGMLIAGTIIRPVEQLVDTTRAIRAGNLGRRVNLKSPDELGELGRSFDHMTNQLVQQNRQINTLYLQQLEETTRRDAVLGSIGDAVLVLDVAGNIYLRNDSAQRLIDSTSDDPEAHAQFLALLNHPESAQKSHTVEFSEQFFSLIARPVHLPNGNLLGHVVVFRDITAIVQAEKLKDDLILQMSHELRTPLTAASGYVDLIQMIEAAHLSDQGLDYLSGAREYLTALERLISQVEDVTAVQAGRFHVDMGRCNLSEIVTREVSDWRKRVPERDLELSLFLPPADIWIEGDARRLRQLFDHLLRNAYSYTLPGGSIEVQLALRDGSATVYILDTGVGIAEDELPLVFERMYRGHSAEAGPTDSSGLGLGLYLAQHIMEAHGGTIALDSRLGRGTIVKVELPTVAVEWNEEHLEDTLEPVAG